MSKKSREQRMPVLFIGHGSPMNAIENNDFTKEWINIAREIPRPEAILCISAHWYVPSTMVTAMKQPRTIHDFWGFPPELYELQYPAPGSFDLASTVVNSLKDYTIGLDQSWGLDHGTWSVLKKMYPDADIPTIQLSIDYSKPPQFHYDLGLKLAFLRSRGVLIIGSGNMVHNLGMLNPQLNDLPYGWAEEFERETIKSLTAGDDTALVNYRDMGRVAELAHPYIDHYLPLLYAKGAAGKEKEMHVSNQQFVYGSVSMTCLRFE
jgi:4,5-DOPA dioxygenase extradiol